MALAYTVDSKWRNRNEFFERREAIEDFLRRKWSRELDYRLKKELWCYQGNRISVRFEYETQDTRGQWWRSHLYDRFATPSSPPSAGSLGLGALQAVAP